MPYVRNKFEAMDLGLKNKVIIVTGGAKGIGAGIVKVLAAEGAIPVIVGRSEADNKAMVDEVAAGGGAGISDRGRINGTGSL